MAPRARLSLIWSRVSMSTQNDQKENVTAMDNGTLLDRPNKLLSQLNRKNKIWLYFVPQRQFRRVLGICKIDSGGALLERCAHRTGPVLLSDQHWDTVIVTAKHCSGHMTQALLPLAAVVSWSLSWVTVKHCLMIQLLHPLESFTKCKTSRGLFASVLIHCLIISPRSPT